MANYFQDPSQTFVPTPVYRPPFEALQDQLTVKQGKFDAGLSAIRSARNSVFNATLTNGQNSEVQAQYLKEADEKLKNLAQVDVSKSENMNAGVSVYGNFLKDKAIQRDIVYTQQQKGEIGKFQSFKPDDKNKDDFQYADPRSLQDMQNGMEKVRNASRGDLSVYNVREFTPFTDIQKYMGKMVVDQKIAIESVDSKGGISYKKTNGPESYGNWMTIASAMTQDRFNKQFQVEARVGKEEGIKRTKETYRQTTGLDIDDQQALPLYVQGILGENFNSYKKQSDGFKDQLTQLKTGKEEFLKNKPDATPDELNDWMEKIVRAETSFKQAAASRDMYDPSTEAYKTNFKSFVESPDAILYSQIRNNTINNLATFFAANEKKDTPTEDVAYKLATEANQRNFNNQLAVRKDAREEKETQYKIEGGDGTGTRKGKDGKPLTDKEIEEQDVNSPHYTGLIGNEFQNVDPTKRFQNEQQVRYETAVSTFLNPNSTAGILEDASKGLLSYDDVRTFTSLVSDGRKSSSYSAAEKAISTKVINLLAEKGISANVNDKNSVAVALHTFAGNYFKSIKGSDKWNDKTIKILSDDSVAGEMIETYNNYNKLHSDSVVDKLSGSEYKNLVVTRDGVKDVVNGSDIAKEMGEISGMGKGSKGMEDTSFLYSIFPTKITTKINGDDFGKAYLKGNVKITKDNEWQDRVTTLKGYKVKVGDAEELYVSDPAMIQKITNLETKYGNSKKLAETLNKANEVTIPTIAGYSKTDAQMGQEYSYHFSATPKETDLGVQVIKEVTLPGNFDVVKTGGKQEIANDLVTKIHKWGVKEVAEYLNPPVYHTANADGVPTVILSFKSLTDAQLTQLDIEREDLPATLELPVKDNKSPHLQQILHPDTGMYTYGKLTRGESHKASELEKSLNFDYDMVPDKTNNPSQVRVNIRTKQLDASTGQYVPYNASFDMSFADFTPDQMKKRVDEARGQHIARNVAAQKQIDETGKITTDAQKTNRALIQKMNEEFNAKHPNN